MFHSIWDEVEIKRFPSLQENIKTEVAVVGGGIAGLLIAYELQKLGKNVVVLDANRIGHGMTMNTTAKITSQHNMIYQELIENFGMEKAREYARYSEKAIKEYENVINQEQIECDFKREDAYVYTLKMIHKLENEVSAARSLGIDAEFTTETALPFQVAGAVKFPNQANLHPIKFMKGIVKHLTIYEDSMVTKMKNSKLQVTSTDLDGKNSEYEVEAETIVIANHYPFERISGFYAARMYQERENIVVVEAPEALKYGMYIGENNEGFSFRKYRDFVIMAGQSHRTGTRMETNSIEDLELAAKQYFNDAPICYRMANQDCMTLDKVPFIGKYTNTSSNVYVATGFNKWGMSHAMVSALILSEMIGGGDTKEDSIFNPNRFPIKASKDEFRHHLASVMKHMTLHKVKLSKENLEELKNGEGMIVSKHGHKLAVYRDENGEDYVFSARCPHLGCILEWNQEEKSWDCPCHGSRFNYKGELISGPAKQDLEEKEMEIE